jgi:hypothetical protein
MLEQAAEHLIQIHRAASFASELPQAKDEHAQTDPDSHHCSTPSAS